MHDIIGKHLLQFYLTEVNGIVLPKVLVSIYDYFLEDIKRIRTEFIFKHKPKSVSEVDALEQHISFGNYLYLVEKV